MLKIELSEQKVQPVMMISTTTRLDLLPNVIREGLSKILAYLTECGEQPVFAPFSAYYSLDMQENLDIEIGFPVSRLLPEKDYIKASKLPPGKVISCLYKGPYCDMDEPYIEMAKWIKDNGYAHTGVSYEYYLNGPQEVPDSELLTMIVMPVDKAVGSINSESPT